MPDFDSAKFQDFSELLSMSVDVFWETNKDFVYTYISPSVKHILEYEPEEIIGKKTPFDLFSDSYRENLISEIKKGAEDMKTFHDHVNWNCTKSGKDICLQTNAIPIPDPEGKFNGYRGIDKDVTKSVVANNSVLKQKEFSEAVIESLPGIFFIIDNRGKFIRWNSYARQISGYIDSELSAMNILSFFENSNSNLISTELAEIINRGYSDFEASIFTKDQIVLPYYFSLRLIPSNPEYIVGVGFDTSNLSIAKGQLNEKISELERLNKIMVGRELKMIELKKQLKKYEIGIHE